MLDHITVYVSDYPGARAFYTSAFAPLGATLLVEVTPDQTGAGHAAGFGKDGKAVFWIIEGGDVARTHAAFMAPDHASVDAFYSAALAAGGRDNGPPGPRPHYHPDYYGAFVLDPDGHNIEAVYRAGAG
jgi:catechol 2,3-dioxygenase-like lactoylglutathione lyase family enzyme